MKKKLRDNPKRLNILLFVFFFLVIFLLEGFCDTSMRDDLVHAAVMEQYGSLWRFLSERFMTWSSRLIADSVTVLIAPHPFLWRILNAVISSALLLFSGVLFSNQHRPVLFSILLSLSLLLITGDAHVLSSAGWITTTVNYLWPFAFGVFALYPLRCVLSGESCTFKMHVVCTLFLLLSANTEQTAVILCVLYAAAFPLLRKKTGLPRWYMVHLLVLVFCIVLILLCPGNRIRIARETLSHMPYFNELTMTDKLFSGFLLMSHELLGGNGFSHVTLLLLFLFVLQAFWGKRTRPVKIMAILPAVLLALSMLLHLLWQSDMWHTGLRFLGALWHNDRLPRYSDYDGTAIAFQTVFSLALLCFLLFMPFLVCGRSLAASSMCAALCSGFLSILMLGFSPTLYASGERILFPCLMIFLFLISFFLTRILSRIRFPAADAGK